MDEKVTKGQYVSNDWSRLLDPDNKFFPMFVDGEPEPWKRVDLPLKEAR